jgi:hypothetical protein
MVQRGAAAGARGRSEVGDLGRQGEVESKVAQIQRATLHSRKE